MAAQRQALNAASMHTKRNIASASHAVDWNFDVPLGGASHGRLVLERETPDLLVSADSRLAALALARFDGERPETITSDGALTIRYAGRGITAWLRHALRSPRAQLVLNAGIPWFLDMRGGIHRLAADLRQLPLAGIDMNGGVYRAELWLPHPNGTVRIRVASGVNSLTIHRHPETAMRLSFRGGVASLQIDDAEAVAVDSDIRRATPDWASAPDRYDVTVSGGANQVLVTE
jgi:hypothetical protein